MSKPQSILVERPIHSDETKKIELLLVHINEKLKLEAVKTKDPALMYGKAGMLLFLCYYQRFRGTSENDETIEILLEQIFENLQSDSKFGYHLAGGLTGVFWVLRHLVNQKLLDADIIDGLTETEDQFLNDFIESANEKNNYDLFYGTIGAGLLLLERETMDEDLLKKIFAGLVNMKRDFFYGSGFIDPMPAIRQDKNEDFEGDKIKEVYNLGMAHGSPSVMVFLALLNETEVCNPAEIENLIRRIEGFMAYHQMDKDSISTYPIWFQPADPDPFPARLSWCYGDLSIACGYALIGKKMGNSGFTRNATALGLKTTTRNSMSETNLFDACLCHGSAGNMHIYRRLYEYTGDESFFKLENHWCKIGLEMHEQTPAKELFRYFDGSQFDNNLSFLEGLAGTGLGFLARIDNHDPAWDRLLLLS